METTTIIIIIIIICICISSSIGIGIYLSSSSEPPNETDSDTGENTSGGASSGAAGTSATSAAPAAPAASAASAASGTSVNASGTSVAARGTSVFKVIGSNDTNFDDEGGGNTIYLDRQNVNCKDNAIKRFHLSRGDGSGKMKYEVSCSSGDLGSSTNKDTGANDWGGGNTIYLDRHNIDCGSDSVLTQFRLIRPSESQIRYDYTCKKSNKSLTCRDVNTPANDWGGGNAIYLDRHDVSCNENEVLSQVHLTRPTGGEISYKYKCCKY